jgi:hypothetical protein
MDISNKVLKAMALLTWRSASNTQDHRLGRKTVPCDRPRLGGGKEAEGLMIKPIDTPG